MPKAPAKKSAAKRAVPPAADTTLSTKSKASNEPAPPADETTDETVQRASPPMQAADEPTDFDNLVDCARVVDKTFGSEMPKEGTNNFMIRLLTAISNTTTEQFDSLPLSAQTWYENGCQEGNDKKDITPPTGYVKPEVAAKATVTKKAAGEKKAAVVKKEKAAKEPKAPKEKKVREASKTMPVRLAMCADPSLTVEQLVVLLPKIGRSTLATTRADVLATLNAARNSGWTAPAA